ncbi:MAG: hypothetical protein NT067_03305 [Candidatus Diapherotrites archaeon]|nr:hypothetical protein [Candidatus Diapherotrites archaeon]
MPAPVPKRPKPRPVLISDALSHLSLEQRTLATSGHGKQRFRNAVRVVTGGRPVEPRKMWYVARRAAKLAFGESPKMPDGMPGKNAGRQLEYLLDWWVRRNEVPADFDLNVAAFGVMPTRHFAVFSKSMARVEFRTQGERSLAGFSGLGPVMQAMVKPVFDRKANPEIVKGLERNYEHDLHQYLEGAVGYVSCKFHQGTDGRPVLVVWNWQPRALNLSRHFLKQYREWPVETMKYLEEIGRRAGASMIAVCSQHQARQYDVVGVRETGSYHVANVTDPRKAKTKEHIIARYGELEKLLAKDGYKLQDLGSKIEHSGLPQAWVFKTPTSRPVREPISTVFMAKKLS